MTKQLCSDEEELNSAEGASLLGTSAPTLAKYVREGILPGRVETLSRRIRVRRSDVLALRASWEVRPKIAD